MTPPSDHRAQVATSIRVAILAVSDTRTTADDHSGAAIRRLVTEFRHTVCDQEIVRDEPAAVRERVSTWCASGACDAILITGGTGLARRDTTIEAVASLFEKHIDGFGELFRMLSYQEIGALAMLSRAVAGSYEQTAVFCMPGSTAAVTLAMEKLILPVLPHLVSLLRPSLK